MTTMLVLLCRWSIFVGVCFVLFLHSSASVYGQRSYFKLSSWYDWGKHGIGPFPLCQTCHQAATQPNVVQKNDQCSKGLLFVESQRRSGACGLMVFDSDGHLVWMPSQSEFHNARDFQVHNVNQQNFITFLSGSEVAGGGGTYTMLDSSYTIHKSFRAVGNVAGHLSGLRFTKAGTALITISQAPIVGQGYGKGDKFDTIFQEISLEYNQLLFEWRASQHYMDSLTAKENSFPIQSVDRDIDGNYLISTRNTIICLSGKDGRPLWQFGGNANDFQDLSGATTSFSDSHRASWQDNTTVLITNNHPTNTHHKTLPAAMLVHLDVQNKTATLIKAFDVPKGLPSPLDTFQFLDDTILATGEHQSTAIEFSNSAEALCETHFPAARFRPSWMANYRISKHQWSGHPNTQPELEVRPEEKAVYVSWNGATEADAWVLQSGPRQDGDLFIDHLMAVKKGYETRIQLPRHTEEYLRVVALDKKRKFLSKSAAVPKHVKHAGCLHSSTASLMGMDSSGKGQNMLIAFAILASIVVYFRRVAFWRMFDIRKT